MGLMMKIMEVYLRIVELIQKWKVIELVVTRFLFLPIILHVAQRR